MKVIIENIGVFKYAEYDLADLTVICGKNNTGKTYATYSLFGFIDFFKRGFTLKLPEEKINELFEKGTVSINIETTQEYINDILNDACEKYSKLLPKIFSAQEKHFENSKFNVNIDKLELSTPQNFSFSFRNKKRDILEIIKTENNNQLLITLLMESETYETNKSLMISISKIIGDAIKEILFENVFGDCFIASAERTGAVIFKDELNFEKNTLLREIASNEQLTIENIVDKIYNTSYPLPVRRNIDFIRNLESIAKSEGELYKSNPEIINYLNQIVGGEYKVTKEGIYYSPSSSRSMKLTIGESASSVRSLLDIFFYLKHVAKKGDLLIIDEPELNLHPESQRNIARLFTYIANLGIRVFITTHSDYIIKEFNTLLMLYSRKDNSEIQEIMLANNYKEKELISSNKIRTFISDKSYVLLKGKSRKIKIQTLIPALIDPNYGIEATSFDNTINEMNKVQESIIFIKNGSINS